MAFLESISTIGLHHAERTFKKRHCILCNQVSFFLLCVTLLLFFISLIFFGWIDAIILLLTVSLLFLMCPFLNFLGHLNASRLFLIFNSTISILVISLVEKQDSENFTQELGYFLYRFILLGSSILPFILFALREKFMLSLSVIVTFILLIMYDPIHQWLGVGFYQKGLYLSNYYFTNYVVSLVYAVAVGGTFFLKYGFEIAEKKNRNLITQLSKHQREILEASKENSKLIKHNTDLEQFSYTISHNLKDPIANLKGLIKLLDTSSINNDNKKIIKRFNLSVLSLDTTIKDLSNIIDIQNNVTQVYQKLSLEKEIDYILILLQKQIEDHAVSITTNTEDVAHIYSVRLILVSILYNLISNAIKYRTREHSPLIEISSKRVANQILIHVKDNGIGIDMEKNGHKLFGLYKRFNNTEETGKGLGLFLIKQQIKTLKGDIKVQSKLGSGSLFVVSIPIYAHPNKQIIFEDEAGSTLCFDASLNTLELQWGEAFFTKNPIKTMTKAIDFTIRYGVVNWIVPANALINQYLHSLNTYKRSKQSELTKAGLAYIALIDSSQNESNEAIIADLKKIIGKFFTKKIAVFPTIAEAKKSIEKNYNL